MTERLLAVEWNPKLKQTNIQFLTETVENNIRYIKMGDGNIDWLLIAVTSDDKEANRIASQIEKEFR